MGIEYFLRSSFPNGALIGGFVGLISSGAANVKKYREGEIDSHDAGVAVGKDAISTGVSTGVATAASTIFGHSFILMAVTGLAVGVGVKYFWDAGVESFEAKRAEEARVESLVEKRAEKKS